MTQPTGVTRQVSQSRREDLESLALLFCDSLEPLGSFTAAGEDELPTAYAALLAHHNHMTVTLEAYHESLVAVQVAAERSESDWYARQSLLTRQSDGATVQYGIMRIDVSGLPSQVRTAIETHSAPLGRILIRNNLLRDVELLALWRIVAGPKLAALLGVKPGAEIFGRSAAIHLSGQRAVDLLEIVTDEPVAPAT